MSYKLDYEEPINQVVRRLKHEHKEIDRKLLRISKISRAPNGNLNVALSLLSAAKIEILRHAVEEEARLARVIMGSTKTRRKSLSSVKILQEHRLIRGFLEDELPYLPYENSPKEAKRKISEFVDLMATHHKEEEEEAFPLAIEASLRS